MIDLAAIRARDAKWKRKPKEGLVLFEGVYVSVVSKANYDELLAAYDRLAAAARKVTCADCDNTGEERLSKAGRWHRKPIPCPSCADLRRELDGVGNE